MSPQPRKVFPDTLSLCNKNQPFSLPTEEEKAKHREKQRDQSPKKRKPFKRNETK